MEGGLLTRHPPRLPLSQLDAFFVAYQERSGIRMQLGVEVEIRGQLERGHIDEMIRRLVARWPQLGQRLHRRIFGLEWRGDPLVDRMVEESKDSGQLDEWRNKPIDPFREPPFQLLWVKGDRESTLAFRAHHAVADGESFFAISVEAARILAGLVAGNEKAPQRAENVRLGDVLSRHKLLRRKMLRNMWRHTRRMSREASAGRSARMTMRDCMPGDSAICERTISGPDLDRARRDASLLAVGLPWLCAAAWVRAIHSWNGSRGSHTNPLVTLEVPVSLRRGRAAHSGLGNLISPLVLFADATQPLPAIARSLGEQLLAGVRARAHLGVPFFTAPARFLPWPIFRRLAVTTTSTGFATSHFTWLEQPGDVHRELSRRSAGAIEVANQRIYTPVCLHMGAAMAVLSWRDHLQLSVTHRLTAFSRQDASTLIDLAVSELVVPRRDAIGAGV